MTDWPPLERVMILAINGHDYPLSCQVRVRNDKNWDGTDIIHLHLVVPIPEHYPDTDFYRFLYEHYKREWAWLQLSWDGKEIMLSSFYVHAADTNAPILPEERSKGLGKKMLCYALHLLQHPPDKTIHPVLPTTTIRLEAAGGQCSDLSLDEYESFSMNDMVRLLSDHPVAFQRTIRYTLNNALPDIGLSMTRPPFLEALIERLPLSSLRAIQRNIGFMTWNELLVWMIDQPDEAKRVLTQWNKLHPESEIQHSFQKECCMIEDNEKLVSYYKRFGFKVSDSSSPMDPLFIEMESTVGKVTSHCGYSGKRRYSKRQHK